MPGKVVLVHLCRATGRRQRQHLVTVSPTRSLRTRRSSMLTRELPPEAEPAGRAAVSLLPATVGMAAGSGVARAVDAPELGAGLPWPGESTLPGRCLALAGLPAEPYAVCVDMAARHPRAPCSLPFVLSSSNV